MKKTIRLATLFVLMLFLVACGNSAETTRTFEMEMEGVSSTLVFTVDGDTVIKQTTRNVMDYDDIGLFTKEAAKEALEPFSAPYQNVKGMSHSLEYEESEAIETIEMNYEELDLKDAKDLPGMFYDSDEAFQGVSMEETQEMLEESGYVEVK